MTKKNIVSLVVLGVFIGVFALVFSRSSIIKVEEKPLLKTVPILVASVPSFDFGTISMKDGKVTHLYEIENTGESPLSITKIYTSCMCTTVNLLLHGSKIGPFGMPGHGTGNTLSNTLLPGEKANIEAIFDPAAHGPQGTGSIRRVIYVETEGADKPLELLFKAVVTS